MPYDAFLSYSHHGNPVLAPALHSALQRLACPWWRPRRLVVYRDTTDLAASPGAWTEIARGLDASNWLVLLASPQAAASTWVDKELERWLSAKGSTRILIALVEGDLLWDGENSRFASSSTAVPPRLLDAFPDEPLWVDFRAMRTREVCSRSNSSWVEAIGRLGSPLLGIPPAQLVSDDYHSHRARIFAARSALLAIGGLTLAALFAAGLARDNATLARDRQKVTGARMALVDGKPTTSALLLASVEQPEETPAWTSTAVDVSRSRRESDRCRMQSGFLGSLAWSRDGSTFVAGSFGGRVESRSADCTTPRVLLDGKERIEWVSFDETGRYVVTRLSSGRVLRLSVQGEAPPAQLGERIAAIDIDPAGRVLALGGEDGSVDTVTISGDRQRLSGPHEGQVYSVRYARGGSWIISASADGTVRMRTPDGKQEETVLHGHGPALVADASADGRWVAAGFEDGKVLIRRMETAPGEEFRVVSPAACPRPDLLRFSRDSEWIAFTCGESNVYVGRADGTSSRVLTGHTGVVLDLEFEPSDTRIVTSSSDRTARIWTLENSTTEAALQGHDGGVNAVAFDPLRRRLSTCSDDGTVREWWLEDESRQPSTLRGDGSRITAWTLSPDDRLVAAVSELGAAFVWSVDTGKLARPVAEKANPYLAPSFSADGRVVLFGTAENRLFVASTQDRQVVAIETPGHPTAAKLNPDGRRIAVGTEAGDLSIIGTDGGQQRSLPGHRHSVSGLEWSPRGDRLLSWSTDEPAHLISLSQPDSATSLIHESGVTWAGFSLNGERILTACAPHATVRLWRSDGDSLPIRGSVVLDRVLATPALSPDGQRIAKGFVDWNVEVVPANEDSDIVNLNGHTATIWSMAFRRDAKRLASASSDGTVRVWATDGHDQPIVLPVGSQWMTSQFTGDGSTVIVGGGDDTLQLWSIDSRRLMEILGRTRACALPEERQRYLGESAREASAGWQSCREGRTNSR